MASRTVVNSKTLDGKDVVLVVNKPTAKNLRDAQISSAKSFSEALKSGATLRANLTNHMISQGLWNDEKEAQLKDLATKINEGTRKLAKGGANNFKRSEARDLALNMRKWRIEQLTLLGEQRRLDEWTVEGQAENTRFDYLVFACTTWEDGRPTYDSLEDYREKGEEPYSEACATALANLMYNFDADKEKKLPEVKFLLDNKFIDDKLRLINADGKLIDSTGRLINDEGRYVNEANELVDVNGDKVDADGNPVEEFVEFTE